MTYTRSNKQPSPEEIVHGDLDEQDNLFEEEEKEEEKEPKQQQEKQKDQTQQEEMEEEDEGFSAVLVTTLKVCIGSSSDGVTHLY
ncbi:hypothetical protein G6F42_014135 [Rhizopus arrhizus]|nr:hypothetical protein G6F42_014135 [Rhizopus arrhizus]